MEMKLLQTGLAIVTALFMHHLFLAIANANPTGALIDGSSGGFSLPLVANHDGADHTLRRGADGFLYLQHSLVASASSAANCNLSTIIQPETHPPPHSILIHIGTGNGRRQLHLKVDTTSPLTWLQCVPCSPQYAQHSPLFDPRASPTFRYVSASACVPPFVPDPAKDQYAFGLRSAEREVIGAAAMDTIVTDTGGSAHPRLLFGCVHSTIRFAGNPNYFAGVFAVKAAVAHGGLPPRFSYCLTGDTNRQRQGFLRFGDHVPDLAVAGGRRYRTTRILPAHDAAFYVGVVAVSVGPRRLGNVRPKMFARREDGQGGAMIDLGTPLTVMAQEAYYAVEEAVWSELELHGAERVKQRSGSYGLCVRATEAIKGHLPPLSLHFAGDDATLVVSPEQLFLMIDDQKAGQIACLAMVPGRRPIIGALQQVDTRFVFDLKDNKISFVPESCIRDTVQVNHK